MRWLVGQLVFHRLLCCWYGWRAPTVGALLRCLVPALHFARHAMHGLILDI